MMLGLPSTRLTEIPHLTDMKEILQGAIYYADLSPVKGHEQAGYRPVLVLQNNVLNRFLNTIVIVPITSNLQAKGYLTTFFLPKKISKLPSDSVALLFQIRTLDKSRLKKFVSILNSELLKQIKEQAWLVF